MFGEVREGADHESAEQEGFTLFSSPVGHITHLKRPGSRRLNLEEAHNLDGVNSLKNKRGHRVGFSSSVRDRLALGFCFYKCRRSEERRRKERRRGRDGGGKEAWVCLGKPLASKGADGRKSPLVTPASCLFSTSSPPTASTSWLPTQGLGSAGVSWVSSEGHSCILSVPSLTIPAR